MIARRMLLPLAGLITALCLSLNPTHAEQKIYGTPIPPELIGPGIIEDMATVIERERNTPIELIDPKARNGAQGEWVVPSRTGTGIAYSGKHYVTNKWGDTRMGIGFVQPATVAGAWIAGQSQEGAWAKGLRAVGYRDGREVARTDWFEDICQQPSWFEINLEGVDRIEFEARSAFDGAGWFALDDLTFQYDEDGSTLTVIDFEDLGYRAKLTDTGYEGLEWELGTGEFEDTGVHAPQIPDGFGTAPSTSLAIDAGFPVGGAATEPRLVRTFEGTRQGDTGTTSPPDTVGAAGPNHFVEVVNRNLSIYNKNTGLRLSSVRLSSFQPGSAGDPRVLFDTHSNRWFILNTDFSNELFLAVSRTDDPTGSWFKTRFNVSQGADAGRWPDFPTLGVDADGVYSSAFMVGGGHSIFVIDKAPLISGSPSLGTVTAFRGLPFERAVQPAHTFDDDAPGQYYVSIVDNDTMRIRRVNGPMNNPTLTEPSEIPIAPASSPPGAPALDSDTNVSTVDNRFQDAVYRNGSLWTCHTIRFNDLPACRWYEVNPETLEIIQFGTINDEVRAYYFPSLAIDRFSNMVIGFSGSSATEFIGVYYSGRLATDPLGRVSLPVQYQEGVSGQNHPDGIGRNRWGDYSGTSVDPVDGFSVYTAQTYGQTGNDWATRIGVLALADCNENGIADPDEIAGGAPDCDENLVPDSCDPDCNTNDSPDACDIADGIELDCNNNGVPDSCDFTNGTSADCNNTGVPDECEIAAGEETDCDANGTPDSCDIASGFASDCNNNGLPDTCDIASGLDADCDGNGVLDSCDIAAGTFEDCNKNGVPDPCDVAPPFSAASDVLSPIGNGSPQSFPLTDAQPANSDNVTFTLTASGDFNTSAEFVSIALNGVELTNAFVSGFSDCSAEPLNDVVTVPATEFNDALALSKDAIITLTTTAGVDPNLCDDPSFITIAVDYTVAGLADSNGNQIPDECEQVLIGDLNCDGTVSVGDINPFVLALTDPKAYAAQFPDCTPLAGDCTADGSVTVGDINCFVALVTGD